MRKFRGIHLLFVALLMLAVPAASHAQVRIGVSIRIGPPPLPVYAQPICPGPGYIWTPGYWAYGDDGYYWVPGTWVMAPQPGLLWTPGYWGWGDGVYVWHAGYWGPHVGFYGGVHYGFGYDGVGYQGGYWRGNVFYYNRYVNHLNIAVIHNVYNHPYVDRYRDNRVSFNGGQGGLRARPTPDQQRWDNERHVDATAAQIQHRDEASRDRGQWASQNHGRPAVVATPRPGGYSDRGVVRGPANRPAENRPNTNRPNQNRPNMNRPNANRGQQNRPQARPGNQNRGRQQNNQKARPSKPAKPKKQNNDHRPGGGGRGF